MIHARGRKAILAMAQRVRDRQIECSDKIHALVDAPHVLSDAEAADMRRAATENMALSWARDALLWSAGEIDDRFMERIAGAIAPTESTPRRRRPCRTSRPR